jgi:hypothetical protein
LINTWPAGKYSVTTVHEVDRAAVSRFATAIGATDPAHHEPKAAQAAGFADVVAPPTFPIVFLIATQERLLASPELDFDYSRVVHREQHFRRHRPIEAGRRLSVTTNLTSIEELHGNSVATFDGHFVTDDVTVCTVQAILVSRAAQVPA